MADEMKIVITVDGSQAKATIAQVEQGLVSVTKAARAQTAVSNQQTAAWREEAAAQKAIGAEIQNSIHAKNLSAAASRAQAAASNSQAASLRQEAIAQRINAAATQAAAAEIGRETALKRQATAEIQNRIAQLRLQAAEERNATAAVSAHNREISHAASVTRTTAVSTNGFASALQSLGIAALGYKFITTMIQDTMALDSALARLSVSSDNVGAEFQFISQTANRLGTNLRASLDQFSLLSAATAGTTLEGDKTRKMFIALSTAASALNMSTDQTAGIFRAFQQMASKGTVQMEELKGQLGDRLPGALKLTADAMDMTTGQLIRQIEKGQVMSSDMLPKLADAMIHTYGDVALTTSQNARAQFNRLDNAVMQLMQTIGNSGPMQVLATTAGFLANNMQAVATVTAGVVIPVLIKLTAVQIQARVASAAAVTAALAQQRAEDLRTLSLQRVALAQQLANLSSMAGVGASTASVIAIQKEIAAITAKQAALMGATGGAGLLRGAIGLLGGGVAAVTTALALGVAAWAIWGNSADSAVEKASQIIDRRIGELMSEGLTELQAIAKLIEQQKKTGSAEKTETKSGVKKAIWDAEREAGQMEAVVAAQKRALVTIEDQMSKSEGKKLAALKKSYDAIKETVKDGEAAILLLRKAAIDKSDALSGDEGRMLAAMQRKALEKQAGIDARTKKQKADDAALNAKELQDSIRNAVENENATNAAKVSAEKMSAKSGMDRLLAQQAIELKAMDDHREKMLRGVKPEGRKAAAAATEGGFTEAKSQILERQQWEKDALQFDIDAEAEKRVREASDAQWRHDELYFDKQVEIGIIADAQRTANEREAASARANIIEKTKLNGDLLTINAENISRQFDLQIGALDADRQLKMDRGVWTDKMERDFVDKRVALELEQAERITTIQIDAAQRAYEAEMLSANEELIALEAKGELTVQATEAIQARIEVATAAHKGKIAELEAHEVKVHRATIAKKQGAMSDAAKFADHLAKGEYMSAVNMGVKLLDMTGKSSKKMFEVKKAAGIATTVINGIEQISQAAKLVWPANIPAVAYAIADVAARVVAMKSQQYEGGGGSAGGSAGAPSITSFTPAAPVAQPAAVQNPTLNITVNAPGGLVDPIVAQQLADSLAPHLQDAFNNGFNNVVTP